MSYLFVNWHVDGDELSYSIVVLHNPISNPYLSLLYVKDHLYYGRCIISGLSKEPHIKGIYRFSFQPFLHYDRWSPGHYLRSFSRVLLDLLAFGFSDFFRPFCETS